MNILKKEGYVPAEKTNVAKTMVAWAARNKVKLPKAIRNMANAPLPIAKLTIHRAAK